MHRCWFLIFSIITLIGCHTHPRKSVVPDPAPSAYYWRTALKLNAEERERLVSGEVRKLYVRFFDVVNTTEGSRPNATIDIQDSLPATVHVIPTVYIENACLRDTAGLETLAVRIVERVVQMSQTHHIEMHEMQIDCDWAASQQAVFTRFAQLVADRLHRFNSEWLLSATIRLHQLSQTPPPVDYGVLMLYNTGDVRRDTTGVNPILSMQDVVPYMSSLARYDLPLCAAYPRFSMPALYCEGKLQAVLYDEDIHDTVLYRPLGHDRYQVLQAQTLTLRVAAGRSTIYLHPGEIVHDWHVPPALLDSVRQAVQSKRPDINMQEVYYPL